MLAVEVLAVSLPLDALEVLAEVVALLRFVAAALLVAAGVSDLPRVGKLRVEGSFGFAFLALAAAASFSASPVPAPKPVGPEAAS